MNSEQEACMKGHCMGIVGRATWAPLSLKEDNMAIILLGVIERRQLAVYKEPVALR